MRANDMVSDTCQALNMRWMTWRAVSGTTRAEPLCHERHGVWRGYPQIRGYLSTDQPAGVSLCLSQ